MIAEFINTLAVVNNLEKAWQLYIGKMAEYGIERVFYGSTRFRTSHSLGDPEDFVILTNHSRAYVDAFFSRGYYKHAPMVKWSLDHLGAISWRHVHTQAQNGSFSELEKEIYAFNQKHRLFSGYSISFLPTQQRQHAAMGLVAANGMTQDDMDAVWVQHGNEITAISNLLHLKVLTLPYSPTQRTLTARQREVLEWVGDGKTIQDIALLLTLKAATVEKHLRLAREALNVETTAQAVLKAAFLNQIFVLDAPSDAD